MTDTRNFTTLPANAIGDSTLTSLDLRCLAAISLHDGMSLIKETGAGCYAAFSTLARKVGTDVTNFSKSLSKLIKRGYVVKEPQLHDRRRSTLRVVFPEKKKQGPDGEKGLSPASPKGPDDDNDASASTEQASRIVGDGQAENVGIPGHTDMQYISLNEELNSEEPRKEIRLKARIHNNAPQAEALELMRDEDVELGSKLTPHLANQIHKSFSSLNPGAQVIKVERWVRPLLVDNHHLSERVIDELCSFLGQVHELYPEDKAGLQAFRLSEELAQCDYANAYGQS